MMALMTFEKSKRQIAMLNINNYDNVIFMTQSDINLGDNVIFMIDNDHE